MVVLGLLLLLASGAVLVAVLVDNTDAVTVSALGSTFTGLSVGQLFALGAAVGAIAVLALAMMLSGARRKRSRRVESKQKVRRVSSEKQQLLDENAALKAKLSEPSPTSVSPERRPDHSST